MSRDRHEAVDELARGVAEGLTIAVARRVYGRGFAAVLSLGSFVLFAASTATLGLFGSALTIPLVIWRIFRLQAVLGSVPERELTRHVRSALMALITVVLFWCAVAIVFANVCDEQGPGTYQQYGFQVTCPAPVHRPGEIDPETYKRIVRRPYLVTAILYTGLAALLLYAIVVMPGWDSRQKQK